MATRVVAVHYRLADTPDCQIVWFIAALDSSESYQGGAVGRIVRVRARDSTFLLTVPSYRRGRPNFVTLLPVAKSGRRGEVATVLVGGT